MIASRLTALLAASLACALLASQDAGGQNTSSWSSSGSQTVELLAGDGDPWTNSAAGQLRHTIRGAEASQCERFGRTSSSTGNADSRTELVSEGLWRVTLNASAVASGGHYRDCVSCIAKKCVGFLPHDTEARSTATATQVLDIPITDSGAYNRYRIDISPSEVDGLMVSLRDQAGTSLLAPRKNEGSVIVEAAPGQRLLLEASLQATAADTGGCCNAAITKSANVAVSVTKAPILAAAAGPLIRGAIETDGYPEVVVIRLRRPTSDVRDTHCSGTVIGESSILTAAHCIQGYETAIRDGRMDVVIGSRSSANDPSNVFAVSDFAFPKESNGPKFEPATLKDDIGLVFVNGKLPAERATLHEGAPEWASVVRQRPLAFVGFGYDLPISGALMNAGVKRRGDVPILRADELRIYFNPTTKEASPCKGDSGGPAFLEGQGSDRRVQMAITSGSQDRSCEKEGYSTRVDAYHDWLRPRIR